MPVKALGAAGADVGRLVLRQDSRVVFVHADGARHGGSRLFIVARHHDDVRDPLLMQSADAIKMLQQLKNKGQ